MALASLDPLAARQQVEGCNSLFVNFNNISEFTQLISPVNATSNIPETLMSSNSASQIVSVAYNLYTYGAFLFLVLSMILLLAMIAPIYISKDK